MPMTDEIEHYLIRELSILKAVSHPNLIEYMGAASKVSDDTREIYTITEFMAGGDLLQLLVNPSKDLGYRFRIQIASGAALGLAFLHSQKILHRDIKSPNIVLDQFWNCKITDFGFARVADTETGATRRMTICGTDQYVHTPAPPPPHTTTTTTTTTHHHHHHHQPPPPPSSTFFNIYIAPALYFTAPTRTSTPTRTPTPTQVHGARAHV